MKKALLILIPLLLSGCFTAKSPVDNTSSIGKQKQKINFEEEEKKYRECLGSCNIKSQTGTEVLSIYPYQRSCLESCFAREQVNPCVIEPNSGSCDFAGTLYYFDKSIGACKNGPYGGCGGIVPFGSLQSCKDACE